ncbi:MAG: hypothetical protein ACF8TS_11950 [Maioricimonas sp. JB049]
MPIRSGRFHFPVNNITSGAPWNTSNRHRLSYGGRGALYRIFNSTDRVQPLQKYFRIAKEYDASSSTFLEVDQNLFPTMSIDVVVGGGSASELDKAPGLSVIGHNGVTGTGESLFEGSFDLIRTADGALVETRRRSGRFNFPARIPDDWTGSEGATSPFFPVLLADLGELSTGKLTYRVINTGENPFKLMVGSAELTVPDEQSIDLDILAGQTLSVKRDADQDASRDAIRGVFDVIG